MDRKDWRWTPPPWIVAWILLLCSVVTLVIVIRCCCKDAGGSGPGPEEPQPTVPLTKMRLSQPGPDVPPPTDPKPITNATYRRASGPGGSGTVRPAVPPSPPELQPQPIPATPVGTGQAAEHTPSSSDGTTQSFRIAFALEGDGPHVSPWITGQNSIGQLRAIKEAEVMFLRRSGNLYVVRVSMRVYNATGTGVESPDVVIPELVMGPGTL